METVEELTKTSFAGVPDDTKLIEMGIDSLKMMQLGAYIEEKTGQPMYKKDIVELTVGRVRQVVR
tara:strand:- start:1777 stop:1971 length:195 start_codon:yes stop_codon:yes gene_type:complete